VTRDGHIQELSTLDPGRRAVLELVSAAADLTLVVGAGQVVETVVAGPQSSLAALATGWEGRPLEALFAEESWSKLSQRLAAPDSALPLELNHAGAAQYEFPVRYTLRRWPGTDKLLMLGRDLRPMAEVQPRADGRELVSAAHHIRDDGPDRGSEQQCGAASGCGAE